MRRIWGIGACLALLGVPAFADGDTESASTTLNVDIESAVTVSIDAFSGPIVLNETKVESGDLGALNATKGSLATTVNVRSNDEATLYITSTPLAPTGAESAGGPTRNPGSPLNDPVLNYDVRFLTSTDGQTWDQTSQPYAYNGVSGISTAGAGVKNGANGTGQVFVDVYTGPQWEDAFAGQYTATITATLSAAPN